MSYRKGAKFEYRVKKFFEEEEYYVVRSAGSHGVADLVAIHSPLYYMLGNKVVLVQCSISPKPVSEVRKLLDLCNKLKTIPCLAFKDGRELKILMGREVADYVSAKSLNQTPNK